MLQFSPARGQRVSTALILEAMLGKSGNSVLLFPLFYRDFGLIEILDVAELKI
jgi:hypothetical protein